MQGATGKRTSASSDDNDPKSKKQRKDADAPPSPDELSDIHLEGEENEETPIFDTCDDVRKKMTQALAHTTQADFARKLSAVLPTSSVSTRQLAAFLKFKGPQDGAHSPAFYAGYVYFEKLRIKEDKKKSAKREKVEQIWSGRRDDRILSWHSKGSPLGGFPREGMHKARMNCIAGERWRMDQYGETQIYGTPRTGAITRKGPSKNPW